MTYNPNGASAGFPYTLRPGEDAAQAVRDERAACRARAARSAVEANVWLRRIRIALVAIVGVAVVVGWRVAA